MVVPFRFGHMLGIEPLSAEEILFLLDQSKPFQEIQRHPLKKLATLRGKTVALAFFEPSTRTRISFATAAARLGADQMNLQAESSSLKKGESLLDTVRTLDAIHLATALHFARAFPALPVLTFDERILANLEPLGLASALPPR